MKAEFLDYRDLPGQNPLFLRYLYEFDDVRAWYPGGPLDPDVLKSRARRLLSRPGAYDRRGLVDALTEFNREIGSSAAGFENIRRLGEPSTVAVVTGQQVGFLGGPALGVYKAMTAIRVAEMLREEGVSAVPVFWLASDDSDYQEVASTELLDDTGRLLHLEYPGPENRHQMAGTVRLEKANAVFEQLDQAAVRGPFTAAVIEALESAYAPGRTFRHAFGSWMARLFADHGLILHDALSVAAKHVVRDQYAAAVRLREEVVKAAMRRARDLDAQGVGPQVQVGEEETFLFCLDGDERHKLECRNGRYITRDATEEWDQGEVIEAVSGNPGRFSPNVLLRPILQDCLFPTVAYVGGPAELAYFAQVHAMAPFWEVEPAVLPRVGVTILDAKAQRLLTRYGLHFKDILGSLPETTLRRLTRESEAGHFVRRLDALKATIQKEAADMRDEVRPIEPTVSEMFGRSEAKILYHLNKLQDRFIRNYAVQSSDLDRHVTFLHNSLFPEQKLQERVLNFNHFLMLMGPSGVSDIVRSIQPFCKEHHILYVSTS